MSEHVNEDDVVEPDWEWVDELRPALAHLPFPVAAPDGEWDALFLSDSWIVGGTVRSVAVAGVRGDLWVEVHSGEPGEVHVADRLAEHGGASGAEAGEPTTVTVDGHAVPARSWPLPDGVVLLVEAADVVRTVTVTGGPVPAAPDLVTVTDVVPLLDEYVRVVGWSRP